MTIDITLQNICDNENIPTSTQIDNWISTVLNDEGIEQSAELCIRVVDEQEGAELNNRFRNKNYATNILSFDYDLPEGVNLDQIMLGDLVVCANVLEQEAQTLNIPLTEHWAHILIHGTLHLLGYDHENDADAEEMENKEIKIMAKLGFANPYQE